MSTQDVAADRDHGIHPNLILAVTALAGLAYAMLSSAVIPALTRSSTACTPTRRA